MSQNMPSSHPPRSAPDEAVTSVGSANLYDEVAPVEIHGLRSMRRPTPPTAVAQEAYELYKRKMLVRQTTGPALLPTQAAYHTVNRIAAASPQAQRRAGHSTVPQYGLSSRYIGFSCLAALGAVLIGGGVGYTLKHHTPPRTIENTVVAVKPPVPLTAASTVAQQKNVTEKSIDVASLKVADAEGVLNKAIPLALMAVPAYQGQDMMIKISGLPKDALLNQGTRLSETDWLLKPEDTQNLSVVISKADSPDVAVSVSAIEPATGDVVSPSQQMTISLHDAVAAAPQAVEIIPVNAPPETVTTIKPRAETYASENAVKNSDVTGLAPNLADMLKKGDHLFTAGDLVSARQFYQLAFQQGASIAALQVGKTYDPVIFAAMRVQGITPDAEQARAWYEKAQTAHIVGAAEALAALEQQAAAGGRN